MNDLDFIWVLDASSFMESVYHDNGGTEEFNCVDVELSINDIDNLETNIKEAALPETEGFFFGNDSSEYYREQDLGFCADARKALEDGYTVVYSSWW